ncbi:uncharacterized protein UMAG_11251 [Mycosarcoma maydis]|uniref:Uncharacterized protein n=1 Tax=Mycosarcoma maydis TaxID=5270 RepID=A0A0D1CCR2_MYCMD|nr:uncharacterized protein UMAG_11251 [Ustilago maydis 521]KIS70922.1 hypothetical protein UMAG_11251 [Ustilago maydis 521]|eukprot:XP_011387376.1 hypothetical protein UMAG_11251 [Ustilago maydis 521]
MAWYFCRTRSGRGDSKFRLSTNQTSLQATVRCRGAPSVSARILKRLACVPASCWPSVSASAVESENYVGYLLTTTLYSTVLVQRVRDCTINILRGENSDS